ncbi:MAG TPA: Mur ligase family protein [Parcubacteria group bacterium]|nr:Mur ligase family protein [Parcubacteria group bacterium]
MLDKTLNFIKKFIPRSLFDALSPIYHYSLALVGAVLFGFPSRKLTVIAVTGTKGKSSTTEIINSIFEAAGHKTALLNTIRFKIGDSSKPNKMKMTVPGRFFLHMMLRKAQMAGCDTAVIELSSEAAKQYRHKFVYLDALVFTNLAPEHIESHGSFEKYRNAKVSLVKNLKDKGVLVVNKDDENSIHFKQATDKKTFEWSTGDQFDYKTSLIGDFNKKNILASVALAKTFDISESDIKKGIENVSVIRGRAEFVKISDKQNFDVVVDYAHTSDSLKELYKAFEGKRKICVLGNTGGGRDKWKRPEMAKVADEYCDQVFLTNEDPYDEDPDQIIKDMLPGFKKNNPKIIMDRRQAINTAIKNASAQSAVLITGKGTDPYIMLANNERLPWSDYEIAREELKKILQNKTA